MLGAASPTLSGISRGMGQSSMTPRLLLTFSACNKFETIIKSLTTAQTASLLLQKPSGKQFAFLESEGGLHYLDTTCPQSKQQDPQQHVFAVNTVRDNKKHITNNDYLRAVRAPLNYKS